MSQVTLDDRDEQSTDDEPTPQERHPAANPNATILSTNSSNRFGNRTVPHERGAWTYRIIDRTHDGVNPKKQHPNGGHIVLSGFVSRHEALSHLVLLDAWTEITAEYVIDAVPTDHDS